jgi:hypothetical protein
MYIDNGVNVNPAWTRSIAVSADGVNWSTIHWQGLDVKSRFIIQNESADARHPFVNKGKHGRITLGISEDQVKLEFDPNDVVNQPTWQGNTPAAVQNAVTDLTDWIGG